jgi:hypothetical protein
MKAVFGTLFKARETSAISISSASGTAAAAAQAPTQP